MRNTIGAMMVTAALAGGCGDDAQGGNGSGTGDSTGVGDGGTGGDGTGDGDTGDGGTTTSTGGGTNTGDGGTDTETGGNDACDGTLQATIRDMKEEHPDFEYEIGRDPDIVEDTLGTDNKPVYAGPTDTTTTEENFDEWYNTVSGVNEEIPYTLELESQNDGTWYFDDPEFFPIDDMGWGNEGNSHNYHFTLEMHSTFDYEGGEEFTFRGDDDVFVFINGKLAIELGGVHTPLEGSVTLDDKAGELGIEPGNSYPIDFFFAERHTTESNFRIETSIKCITPQ